MQRISTPKQSRFKSNLKILLKDPGLKKYYRIKNKTLYVYSTPNKKTKPEFILHKKETKTFLSLFHNFTDEEILSIYKNKGKEDFSKYIQQRIKLNKKHSFHIQAGKMPLKGLRVAIDPGHTACSWEMARKESRFIWTHDKKKEMKFYEADLTYQTARIVQYYLEKQGAQVFISRKDPKSTVFNKTYEEWLKDDLKPTVDHEVKLGRLKKEEADKILSGNDKALTLDFFLKEAELRKRAELINNFQPHITLIIHYNVGGRPNYPFKRTSPHMTYLTKDNYSLVFIPGAFQKEELEDERDRLEFLRLALGRHIEKSIEFSAIIEKHFIKDLKIPPIDRKTKVPYVVNSGIYAGKPGVYARNLKLTRLIHSPLCYTEVLLQNNYKEANALHKNNLKYAGVKTSKRVKQIAYSLYKGILEYYNKRN